MEKRPNSPCNNVDPQDKWLNIVENVKLATKEQVFKNEATAYLLEKESAAVSGKASHH